MCVKTTKFVKHVIPITTNERKMVKFFLIFVIHITVKYVTVTKRRNIYAMFNA